VERHRLEKGAHPGRLPVRRGRDVRQQHLAVGYNGSLSSPKIPIEHWNGTTWS